MTIGVLAVQGAFAEHENVLQKLNIDCFEIRKKADLEKAMDGIILPGGESTAIGRILQDLDMLSPIKQLVEDGLPVLATCAGLILLADKIVGQEQVYLATMPITVRRNAYGRQLGSFVAEVPIDGIGNMQLRFIRAPYVEDASPEVDVIGQVENKIVAVKYKKQIGLSFHPELTNDFRVHQYFINLIQG